MFIKKVQSTILIEGYLLLLQQFQNNSQTTMAYFYCFNPTINSFNSGDEWQGSYSHLSSFLQPSIDFINSSLYTISWAPYDFSKVNDNLMASSPTMLPEDPQIINQQTVISFKKSKKRSGKSWEKEIMSARKNSQSNIINQFFSFFSNRQKSEKIVEACCTLMKKNPEKSGTIISLFYTTIRLINQKRGRKYVNIPMFLQFFNPEQLTSYIPELADKIATSQIVTIQELCSIFRRCSKHYLKNISTSAILTSKRISIVSKEQHLKKRRKFLRSIMES